MDNIFGLAGKGAQRKPKPKVNSAPAASVKIPPGPPADFESLKAAYEAVKEMRDELDRNLENVYMRIGLSKDTITRMLDNPSTYDGTDINAEDLQQRRKSLKQEVRKMVGDDVVEELENKAKDKELKQRKNKTLGARRNWLNMR